MKTTGELRAELARCFIMARDGNLAGDALRGVVGCANQINISICVEIKGRTQLAREGAATAPLGEMRLDNNSADN